MPKSSIVTIPTTSQAEAVSIAVATEGICLPRATSGPVLNLDLMTMVEQLRHEVGWSGGRNSRTVVKHGDFRMILTVMKAGACLRKHHTCGTVLIQVLFGQIRARILDEIVQVPTGHALSLDPNLEHEIKAEDESALLITIAWPRDFIVVNKEPTAWLASLRSIANHIEIATRPESHAV